MDKLFSAKGPIPPFKLQSPCRSSYILMLKKEKGTIDLQVGGVLGTLTLLPLFLQSYTPRVPSHLQGDPGKEMGKSVFFPIALSNGSSSVPKFFLIFPSKT